MFNPIEQRVVLKQVETTGTTAGGVIIPDTTNPNILNIIMLN